MTYKLILKGSPIGTIETTAKKFGDIVEYEGKKYFVQYTKGKAIFVREELR